MSADDKDTLGGRVRRYARVSGKVGGLAARLAGERMLGLPLDRARHASDLRKALGGLKGPLMKVAQIMSTIPEALPDEYVAELTQLQSNAPAMGWPFVKRRMTSELGPDWLEMFDNFERTASAAASLGQVHHATAEDGRDLACKLQYPDMAAAVEADLSQLKLIFAIYRRYDPSIGTSQIQGEIAARLREELDYDLEARHMGLYGQLLANEDQVHVPKAQADLSTNRLLSMSWVEGRALLDYKEADQETRNTLALNMFRAWYVPFYQGGVIHADPHLGNYSVRDDLSINLLDFGCVRSFRPEFIGGVIDLYRALETNDEALAVQAYETWGFTDLSKDVIETLNLWAQFVYAPLLEDRPRQIQEFETGGVYGKDVAAEVAKRLREQGGVTPPREFVFMDRAAIGLGGVFLHLKAEINWHRIFQDLIAGFDEKKLAARQKKLFTAENVPLP